MASRDLLPVARKYLPERPSLKHQIRHLDGNKMNNSYLNLAWGTAKDNADDRERHGRTVRGKRMSEQVLAAVRRSTNPFYRHVRLLPPVKNYRARNES